MSFDKDTRNALAKMVNACRRTLTEDVADQLQETFGIYSDTSLPLDRLTHLTLDDAEAAQALREQLNHFAAAESGRPEERRSLAYDRLILEIAFTILNRLAALRLCEERELVIECVRKGTSSDGFLLFNSISGGALGSIHETYRIFLECMMDELALDLGVLFDRTNPQSAVFPTDRCLKEILDHLNDPDLAFVWSEDETIGWIYQYFNPPEERRAMREASQTPRNSRELAVRNQFFTPRYVVEFLTDNTLGRIWYEMRKGKTSLVEQCRYLVRRPNEMFLDLGEEPPVEDDHEKDFSQEELLNRPVYILHRPKKDPRDIKSLDPACGSAHFLLYDFDLMETIYVEAWNDPESPASEATGRTMQEDYNTLEALRRAMPELILRQNLHGIDIDMRAVQIAAFALWLRAQRSWKAQGIKAKDRPRVTKSNIVCAEPMPGEADMLREFTAHLQPKVLAQLVDKVFEKMKLAGEAGSLLQIDEEIQEAITEAKRQWVQGPLTVQTQLSIEQQQHLIKKRQSFSEPESIDLEFWDLAEELIIKTLKEYAEHAENGQRLRRQLFSEDVARGFAFVDLCRRRYDVILMNPPFGEASDTLLPVLSVKFPTWNKNLLCAFIDWALQMFSHDDGSCGVIFDRTAINKSTYEDFRRNIILSDDRLSVYADLGWEVLDANVEVCACVLRLGNPINACRFFDVRDISVEEKGNCIYELINNIFADKTRIYNAESRLFSKFPNAAIIYDLPTGLLTAFSRYQTLEDQGFIGYTGHQLESERHFRVYWERRPEQNLSRNDMFTFLYNGGSYSRFAIPPRDIVRFGFFSFLSSKDVPSYTFVLRNKKHHFNKGVGFGVRGDFLDAHMVKPETIFTVEGQLIPIENENHLWYVLSLLNSIPAQCLLNRICGQHKYSGYVNLLPTPEASSADLEFLGEYARQSYNIMQLIYSWDETCITFSIPILFQVPHQNITVAAEKVKNLVQKYEQELDCAYVAINQRVGMLYDISSNDDQNELKKCRNRMTGSTIPDWSGFSGIKISGKLTFEVFSYALGAVFGYWDIRMILDPTLVLKLKDPFESLPIWAPGALMNSNGLLANTEDIVSEDWLRGRADVCAMTPEGSISKPVIQDSEYPLRISRNGILVDDSGWESGQPHRDDIVRRIREILELTWCDQAQAIEQEACQILGVYDLRDYFRRPSGFFQDHLKRYSKSRRKAPIYWPLSTASGSYTIWLYYHRLTDQTLYVVVNDYLEPKIAEMERDLSRAEEKLNAASGRKATSLRDKINDGRTLLSELRDLRLEIMKIAALPYKPDLNDGVIINAAPFYKLFRLRSWAEDTEEIWNKLERGEYDWSHLAYILWPDRVKDACRKDRSIAITHGLEAFFQTPLPSSTNATKGKRGRRSGRAA